MVLKCRCTSVEIVKSVGYGLKCRSTSVEINKIVGYGLKCRCTAVEINKSVGYGLKCHCTAVEINKSLLLSPVSPRAKRTLVTVYKGRFEDEWNGVLIRRCTLRRLIDSPDLKPELIPLNVSRFSILNKRAVTKKYPADFQQ